MRKFSAGLVTLTAALAITGCQQAPDASENEDTSDLIAEEPSDAMAEDASDAMMAADEAAGEDATTSGSADESPDDSSNPIPPQ